MRRVRRWLHKRPERKAEDKRARNTSPSLLSETQILPRPRALTNTQSIVQQSSFFTSLPLEIRQHIYDQAFGNKTIHIDLRFGVADRKGDLHANLSGSFHGDRATPQEWRWWSCVCHRYHKVQDGEVRTLDFWLDRCRSGGSTYCQLEGLGKAQCFVGVLGWLKTCRLAYSETVSRLYSTNTFYIGGVESPYEGPADRSTLFQHLDAFLLPRRLAEIRSLELFWNINSFESCMSKSPQTIFERLLNTLVANFPNLQELKIAVQTRGPFRGRSDVLPFIATPMDGVVMHFGNQLTSCELIVGRSWYRQMASDLQGQVEEVKAKSTSFKKFFRGVGDGKDGYWVGFHDVDNVRSAGCRLDGGPPG